MNTSHILTLDDVPGRSVIFKINDIHIPFQDKRALSLAVECAEDNCATHAFLLGDIFDCGVGSKIAGKKARDTIKLGTLPRSIDSGRWFVDWARSRSQCIFFRGNHEAWLEQIIAEDPALAGVTPEDLLGLPGSDDKWTVLSSLSRARLFHFVWEHGHKIFSKGNGGPNPGAKIKGTAPNQVTYVGHLHRRFSTWWTTTNEKGVGKLYAAEGDGHMSITKTHEDYVGGYPNWQQSFSLQYVYEISNRPYITTDHIMILRDNRDRPFFEYRGTVYK